MRNTQKWLVLLLTVVMLVNVLGVSAMAAENEAPLALEFHSAAEGGMLQVDILATESQIVAAMGTLSISMLLMCIDMMSTLFSGVAWLTSITNFLSILSRFSAFTAGLIYYDNVIFFLSLQALFLFLTVRVLDSKRWN